MNKWSNFTICFNLNQVQRIQLKKIGYALIIILIIIQFIRPTFNSGEALGANDITHSMAVPDDVSKILERSCFDCHSNHTNYPWYTNIQPVGYWLQHHVNEGKEELNFSEFNSYNGKRKNKKIKEIAEQIKEAEMPLFSYTIIHKEAKLTSAERDAINKWLGAAFGSEEVNDAE